MTREEYQSTIRVMEAVRIFENWRSADYTQKIAALRMLRVSTTLTTKLKRYEILRAFDWLISEYLKEIEKDESAGLDDR